MEVREIVDTVLREPVLEVRFRLDIDGDDVIRIKEFIIDEISDYGYDILTEDFDLFDDDEWDDDEYDLTEDHEYIVDEDELISFMNEFFLISGDIPDAEFF